MVKNPEQYKAKLNDLNAIFDVRGFLVKLLRFWPVFFDFFGHCLQLCLLHQ